MRKILFHKNLAVVLVLDLVLILAALYIAHLIRFEFDIPDNFIRTFWRLLPLVITIKMAFFFFFDLYRGMWRYTGLQDLLNIIKATTMASLMVVCAVLFVTGFQNVSRSIFIIDWILTLFLIAGFRMVVRLYYEQAGSGGTSITAAGLLAGIFHRRPDEKRLLIIGAGDCAVSLFRKSAPIVPCRTASSGFWTMTPANRDARFMAFRFWEGCPISFPWWKAGG
jgi:FlaA1/EpsC-like NDP-sugar epimerase